MPLSSRSLIAIFAVGLLMCGHARAAGDAQRGKTLAYTCLGCHGIENYKNVYPTYSVPRLVGQRPEYIVAALKEYKSQERSHGTMHAQAISLSDQDMQDLATYLAGTPVKSSGSVVGTPPQKVTALCMACHNKDGVSSSADYPTLAGQHQDYLERTLEEYKHGDRKNAVMPTFMATLTAADMHEISEYYAEQQPALQTVTRRTWWFEAQ